MDENDVISGRMQKLKELKSLLDKTEDRLVLLSKEFNWDYKKLLEDTSIMVTCSINPQHRMPISSLKTHEQKCCWQNEGHSNSEKTFSEFSGTGSFITLTSESLHSITKNVSSSAVFLYLVFLIVMMEFKTNQSKPLRRTPQSSASFDQNFEREEKLAIYDYVIANTQKQNSYPDLWLQPAEKSEEKREKAAWEIAAAERDAKRRRASYRNKVHTNCKTHTEILREVIEAQMETFKEGILSEEGEEKISTPQTIHRKPSHELRESMDKRRQQESFSRQCKEGRNERRNHDNHSKHREHKRSPSDTGSNTKSRSRFHDKHRKWKTYEGRSHSHRSSHTHRR